MKIFVITAIIALAVSACQKEIVNDQLPTADPPGDSIYIKKLILLDTTFSPGVDTVGTIMFGYDDQKRISNIKIYHYTTGSPGIVDSVFEQRLYSANDTLPFKIILTDETQAKDTTFLFYNNAMLIKDSSCSSISFNHVVQLFTQLPNNRFFKKAYYRDPILGVVVLDSSFFMRNWVAPGQLSSYDSVYAGGSLYYANLCTAEYDDHPNPLRKLNLNYIPDFEELVGQAGFFFNDIDFNKLPNTIISINKQNTDPSSSNESYNFFYEYRSDGYPLIQRSDLPDFNKAIYKY